MASYLDRLSAAQRATLRQKLQERLRVDGAAAEHLAEAMVTVLLASSRARILDQLKKGDDGQADEEGKTADQP